MAKLNIALLTILLCGCTPISAEAAQRHGAKKPKTAYLALEGPVTPMSVAEVLIGLDQAVTDGAKQVVLKLNTPGGMVTPGRALAKRIESSPIPVICVVEGEAYSMGFYILQSCQVRAMTPYSSLMAHEISISVESVNRKELRKILAELDVENEIFCRYMARRLFDGKGFCSNVAEGEVWFFDDTAKAAGAIDASVPSVQFVLDFFEASK